MAPIISTKSRKNTLRRLYWLAFSMPCWVFVRASFLKNLKPENPGKLLWNSPRMQSHAQFWSSTDQYIKLKFCSSYISFVYTSNIKPLFDLSMISSCVRFICHIVINLSSPSKLSHQHHHFEDYFHTFSYQTIVWFE